MNIKVRLRNKTFITALIGFIIAFIYGLISLFDISPCITENELLKFIDQLMLILSGFGVFIDPTTKGISDSKQAMSYETPKED